MSRTGLSKEQVIEVAGELANQVGLVNVTVTTLSEKLGIKKPSLYYHVKDQEEVFHELMIYGWKKISEDIVSSINEEDAKNAIRALGYAVYEFALKNPGIFEAMLWYNKYEDNRLIQITEGLYDFFFTQTDKLGIDKETSNHLLRTFRALWEGFSLLVIHNSFGNPISVEKSFQISMDVLLNGLETYRKK